MKTKLYSLSLLLILAVLLTACGNKEAVPASATKDLTYSDTIGLAEFQEWKAYNERVAAVEGYKRAVPKKVRTVKSPGSQSGSMVSSSSNQAKVTKKKGWSKAAKGVTIGAGSGAVLGAVINKKNRALGAVIGGVVGGGIGYGIGRSMDKKDGR